MSDPLQEGTRAPAFTAAASDGSTYALADVLEQKGMADLLSVTAVDDDQEAIVYANNLLKSRAPNGDIAFHHSRPTDLESSEIGPHGYDVIASLFVADYLNTNAASNDGGADCNPQAGSTITAAMLTDGIEANGEVTFPSGDTRIRVVSPAISCAPPK